MIRILLTLMVFLLIPIGAMSAPPTISTAAFSGDELTITGTGLEKATPAPIQWITGEGETPGADFTPTDWVFEESNRWFWSNADSYSGDGSIFTNIQDIPDGAHAYYDNTTELGPVYFTADVKFETTATSADWNQAQVKFMSIRSGTAPFSGGIGSAYDHNPWFSITSQVLTPYQAYGLIVYDGASGLQAGSTSFVQTFPDYEEWHNYSFYGERASAPDTADGTWISLLTQNGKAQEYVHNAVGTRITHGTSDGVWRYVGWRNEITNSSIDRENINLYIDNIYIDNTSARIEIGENSVYTSCQTLSIQPTLTTRNSTTAVIDEINVPDTWRGTTKYLFVTNAGREVSTGYSIDIPQEGQAPNTVGVSINYNGIRIE